MSHYEARMSSKGQLTVPSAVRERLALQAGDIVDFYMDEKSRSVRIVARNRPISELFGMFDAPDKPLTQQDIDNAIMDHLAEDDARITRQWNEQREFEAWKKARNADAAE